MYGAKKIMMCNERTSLVLTPCSVTTGNHGGKEYVKAC